MAIKSKSERKERRIEIDLSGPSGNAFVLLKLADDLGKRLGYDSDHRERILDDMRLSTYEMLLQVFDREFGDFVILWK
tara:strand:- start:471 stop:704 length:234 start_codon:yes stop_codon:yes gene_type:complete